MQHRCTAINLFACLLLLLARTQFTSAQALENDEKTWTFNLEEAQSFAIENNETILSAKLEILKSEAIVKEYKSIALPQVNASLDYTRFIDIPTQILPDFVSPSVYGVLFQENLLEEQEIEFGGGIPARFGTKHVVNANIDASQLVYSGTYNLGLKSIKKFLTKAQLEKLLEEETLKVQVANAYFGLLILDENKKLLESSRTNLDKILYETKALNENGFVEEIEVDRLVLSRSNIVTQIANLERERETTAEALKFIIGMESKDQILLSEDLEKYIERNNNLLAQEGDLSFRVEDKLFQLQAEFDTLAVKQIKSEYLPSLVAFGNLGRSYQADRARPFDDEWFPTALVGLKLSIPIFDGFKKRGQLQQKKIDLAKNMLTRNQFNRSFDVEVDRSKTAYASALASMQNQTKNMELADKIYRVSKIKYNEGLGSSLELTTAEAAQNETRALYIQSLYNLVIAINQLKKTLGKI